MTSKPASSPGLPRSTLVTWLGLVALGLAFVGFLVWFGGLRRDFVGKDHPGVGRRLRSLELVPLIGGGEPLTLDSLAGRVALVNLWGTWCGPCRREFPKLMKLEAEFRSESDFRFVSVSCGLDLPDRLPELEQETAAHVTAMGATFPIYADPLWTTRKAVWSVAYSPSGTMPSTVVLDRTGKVRGIWSGYFSGDERLMEELIREILEEGKH
jgi:thiol-disulfide isomerase/thioredoxin